MNLTHAHKARSSNTDEIFLFSWGDGATVERFCFNRRMVAYFRTSTKEHEVFARSKPETSCSQFPRNSERARMLPKIWRSTGFSISLPWLTFEDNATPRKLLLLVKVRLEMAVCILAITRSAGTKSVTLHQRIKDGQRLQLLHSTKII